LSLLHHAGFEVRDLARSARFYDAVFLAVGGRRMHTSPGGVAYGVMGPELWITARGEPQPGYGHVALRARGRVAVHAAHRAGLEAGGRDAGEPGPRPAYGDGYYAAYLLDPDGLKVEIVADVGTGGR
jgi:catechol 2,3-dioxygenase-like lactoylglutathione lyase family enzyme